MSEARMESSSKLARQVTDELTLTLHSARKSNERRQRCGRKQTPRSSQPASVSLPTAAALASYTVLDEHASPPTYPTITSPFPTSTIIQPLAHRRSCSFLPPLYMPHPSHPHLFIASCDDGRIEQRSSLHSKKSLSREQIVDGAHDVSQHCAGKETYERRDGPREPCLAVVECEGC